MASLIYERLKANLMNKVVDLEGDTINCQLHSSSYTPAATHNVLGDLTNELAATGNYSTGGEVLTTKAVTQAATTDWDADDTVWSSATFTARYGIIVDITATNNLVALIDFGTDKTVTAGTFTIQWHTDGIITLA